MAVTHMYGFETQAVLAEGVTITGSAAFQTTAGVARTGSAFMSIQPSSGAAASIDAGVVERWVCFGLRIRQNITVGRIIAGASTLGNTGNLFLNTDYTISVRSGTTVIGTSTVALTHGAGSAYHWIGWRNAASVTDVLLQIDGADQVSGASAVATSTRIGCSGTEAQDMTAGGIAVDDLIYDDAGFVAPARVALLVPTSDGTIGTGWLSDDGTAPGFDTLDNTPPDGIADTQASTGLHQARHAANNTNAYAMNLTTYADAGVGTNDTVLAVQPFAMTGAASATSPKSGSITLSNPTIVKTTIGTFYNGSAVAATFPTGWVRRSLAVLASPTGITLGNSPVLTITNDTGSTRIALVCFEGVYVAWALGARTGIRKAHQAINRSVAY